MLDDIFARNVVDVCDDHMCSCVVTRRRESQEIDEKYDFKVSTL